MKKKCNNCGNEFPEEINFCTNCGSKLEETKEPSKQQAEQPIQPKTKTSKQPKPVDKILIPIVIVAVILSVVAIILPMVMGDGALTSGSVSSDELANNAVTSSKIADGAITDNDISDDGISKIAALAVTGDNIIADAIEMIHLSTEVSDAITGAGDIANNSLTGAKIKDYTIDTIDIKNNSITAAKIPADAVGSSEIIANAVGASEIASGSVNTGDIADDAITFDKMDIKIKYDIETGAINGTTVSHGLEATPISVILTPIYRNDNYILHANVHSVNSNSFTIALWKETISTGVISEVTSGISIYWIAIR
jgi:hypothetical protein